MTLQKPGSLEERFEKYFANPLDFPLEFTAWLRRFLDEPSNFTAFGGGGGIQEITSDDGTIRIVNPRGPIVDLSHTEPAWFDFHWTSSTTMVVISPSSGGGDTNPNTTAAYARSMVQTIDGRQIPPYGSGTPLEFGTVLGNMKITLNSAGTIAGDSTGVYFLPVTINPSLYLPIPSETINAVIGSGYIKDTSTNATFTGHILGSRQVFVPNIPDLSPPNSGVRNMVRKDWPFTWASGDTLYNGTFMYPMETLL